MFQNSIETPLGTMVIIADNTSVYLIDFTDSKYIAQHIANVSRHSTTPLVIGHNPVIELATKELYQYFQQQREAFSIPLALPGTPFQKLVWNGLTSLDYSTTAAYSQIARNIGKPTSCRAVASAIGKNQFAIIIPCHRVINNNGKLGGYAGGLHRKKWLLNFEGLPI